MSDKISMMIATFFGAGLSKKAPGTIGSLVTLPLAFILCYYFGFDGIFYASLFIFMVGVWATHLVIKKSGEKDPGKVVIDETVGQLISFILVVPYLYHNASYKAIMLYLLGFGLFRFFDIIKMGPVKWADTKVKNAWGVMLDDVFAGFFAALVLMLLKNGL